MSRTSKLFSLIGKAVAVFMVGALGAIAVRFMFGALLPQHACHEVMDIPDRFAELFLEAPDPRRSLDREIAESAGVLGAMGERYSGPGSRGSGLGGLGSEGAKAKREEGKVGRKDGSSQGSEAEPAAEAELRATLRSWFPETLLFAPLVVTDDEGRASVEIEVPDQLTTWRVLGLAHDRAGHQAGDVASFASTMPVYVDLPEPPTLRVGDRLALPVHVVNQRAEALDGSLLASVSGEALRGGGASNIVVRGGAAGLRHVPVEAVRPGRGSLEVELPGHDRVLRPIVVQPRGRPVHRDLAGSLAGERSLTVAVPQDATAASLELVVFPGPMAVLASELERVGSGGHGLDDAAYAYALTGTGRAIAERLGVEVDADALRSARLRAWQDLMRHTRSPTVQQAVVVLAAARGWPEDPMAAALARRMATKIAASQSPDGSFAPTLWRGGVPVEQVLVFTAEAARLTREIEPRVAQRAQGFVTRSMENVRDPHTAAALLAADLVEPRHQLALRAMVRQALEDDGRGGLLLPPSERSRTAGGEQPGVVECTALAALALADDPALEGRLQDLGSTLLGAHRPGRGLGDGLTGLVVLEALAVLFPEPLPEEVVLRLEVDGVQVALRRLPLAAGFHPERLQVPLPAIPGEHTVRISASPAVPGLGFSLRQTCWRPVIPSHSSRGFALRLVGPEQAVVGEPASLQIEASPPGGRRLILELDLPAGLEPHDPQLDALVAAGTLEAWDASQGHLSVAIPAMPDGALFSARLELVPTLAGRFHWGPVSLALREDPSLHALAAPEVWVVGG